MLVLAATEALILVAASGAAFSVAHGAALLPGDAWIVTSVFAGTGLVVLSAMGLYSRRQRSRLAGVLFRALAAVAVAGLAAAGAIVLWQPPGVGWSGLAVATLLAVLGIAATRVAFDGLADEHFFKRRALIYGAGHRAMAVLQLRRRTDQRGFQLAGFVRLNEEALIVPDQRLVTVRSSLRHHCRAARIDEIVVAMDERRRAFPLHELIECRLDGVNVVDIVDFLERETGTVRLDVLNPGWIIFSPGFNRSISREVSKRASDLVASVMLLIVSIPLMCATAMAIKFEDGWDAPILYRQRRVGLGGRVFNVLKFRSMRVNAEEPGRAVWAQRQDARVTRVGAIIRAARIDELPQIFNVLGGDMSMVGPRPERPEFVSELEEKVPYYRERHSVKPGITGWAQLCYPYGSSEHDAAEKLQYDLYYVKNHSLLFDIMILLQTAEVVLWGKGAR